ncbi:MAG: phosphoglycerate mutase [archaeon]|nr:phosphoglycerate mutase [archaeon]
MKTIKIGLMRHFKVISPKRKLFLNSKEFNNQIKIYDSKDIQKIEFPKKVKGWEKCISSDYKRAIQTAKLVYGEEFKKSKVIREVPITPAFNTSLKLPFLFWALAGRFAWLINHKSQPEGAKKTIEKIKKFVSLLPKNGSILIVSHGFILQLIRHELIKTGFKGDWFLGAKNGKIYSYKKQSH